MKTVTLAEFLNNRNYYLDQARQGKIFVYPTDTIYGIGAIINNHTAQHIDNIKERLPGKHYSLIAPNEDRVQQHFNIDDHFDTIREQHKTQHCQDNNANRGLTLILPLRDKISFPRTSMRENGIRYIDHPIQSFVTDLGQGFISTSVNISGQPSITDPSLLLPQQVEQIDYLIDVGPIHNSSSVIIHRTTQDIIRA